MIERISNKLYVGVVEDNSDPKHLGRVRVRVQTIFDNIPTSDIPWAMPYKDVNGNVFNMPEVGKVVGVIFNSGTIYKPEYIYAEHYNINLENKLSSLSDDDYISFKAVLFDQSTQIWRTKTDGLKIDHEYSNINLDSNGNINLNARDNNSKVNIGSSDASEAAILGTTFLEWFDQVVQLLLTNAALLSGGSPVTCSPDLTNLLTEYQNSKELKYLSNNVWINENGEILEQTRDYINQTGDNWQSTTETNILSSVQPTPYTPQSRPETGRPIQTDNSVPNDTFTQTITSEANGGSTITAVSNYSNGQIPSNVMKQNKNLAKNLTGDAAYLMSEASDSLDLMIAAFNFASFSGKQKITFTDGYRSLARQQALFDKYGSTRAAKPGTSNHGWGIAIDMYWGVRTSMYKDSNKRTSGYKHPNYIWFLNNGWKWGWINPAKLRDNSGTDEWWHWEYHPEQKGVNPLIKDPVAQSYLGNFTADDIAIIKASGGTFT
jgi:LAS superfamily LD-carboxypeptidase LdcB